MCSQYLFPALHAPRSQDVIFMSLPILFPTCVSTTAITSPTPLHLELLDALDQYPHTQRPNDGAQHNRPGHDEENVRGLVR